MIVKLKFFLNFNNWNNFVLSFINIGENNDDLISGVHMECIVNRSRR